MERVRDPYPPTPPPGQDDLPYSDGEPMETGRHRQQMNLLIETLRDSLPGRDDVFIGGDMFVYYSELQAKQNDFRGPDFFVVLDAITGRERKSWVVWEENGRLPDVVIELSSPTTVHVDRGEKKAIYERVWRLPEYFLYDPWEPGIEGYRYDTRIRAFVPIEPEPDGSYECRVLGLRLVVRDGVFQAVECPWLRWLDPKTGLILPTGRERANVERSRADAERERADAERARADAERARADALAARIAELEAALKPR